MVSTWKIQNKISPQPPPFSLPPPPPPPLPKKKKERKKKKEKTNCTLRDSVPFVQFKKREKDPWRNDTFIKVADWSLQRYWEYHSSVRVFHVFKIVQMTPNSAKHHGANYKKKDVKISKNVKTKKSLFLAKLPLN